MNSATPLKDWMKCFGFNRNNAAAKLGVPASTFYALCENRQCIVVNDALFVKYEPNLKLQEPRK